MSTILKSIYRFNIIWIEIQAGYFGGRGLGGHNWQADGKLHMEMRRAQPNLDKTEVQG